MLSIRLGSTEEQEEVQREGQLGRGDVMCLCVYLLTVMVTLWKHGTRSSTEHNEFKFRTWLMIGILDRQGYQ